MTIGKDIADKIQNKVEWNKIDWEQIIKECGIDVDDILLRLQAQYPGWYFETMTTRGLALMLQDRGFNIIEESKYFIKM